MIKHLDVSWEPLPRNLDWLRARLEACLTSWRGTPHRPGQCVPGVGVDCVRFVISVLETMSGRSLSKDVRIPQDASFHNRELALGAMRIFLESWKDRIDVTGGPYEPGDVLVVGPAAGGPGHAILVGPEPRTLWHSSSIGVHKTGWALERPMSRVFRVFRGSDRESWE